MSSGERKNLSVHWPVLLTVFTVALGLWVLGSLVEVVIQWDLTLKSLVFYLGIGLFLYFNTGRYWFAPRVRFDTTGIYIKKFREAVLFVPFSEVTRLKGIDGHIFDHRSGYRRFSLFYKDVYGVECRVRIMILFHYRVYLPEPVLFEFIELAESANKDFVYDNKEVGPAAY